jgi:Protein of unknown function (DUF3551)
MRQPAVFVVGLTILALAAATVPAAAQSAYSYPWCLKGGRGGMSCYFTSYQQCRATLSGRGGFCMRSPYYHGPPSPWAY